MNHAESDKGEKMEIKDKQSKNNSEELVTDLPVVEAQAEATKGGRLTKGGNVEFEWKVEEGES